MEESRRVIQVLITLNNFFQTGGGSVNGCVFAFTGATSPGSPFQYKFALSSDDASNFAALATDMAGSTLVAEARAPLPVAKL